MYSIFVPKHVVYTYAYMCECVYAIFKHVFNYNITITRAEVNKVAVNNYADISKAMQLLGYKVIVLPAQAMHETLS